MSNQASIRYSGYALVLLISALVNEFKQAIQQRLHPEECFTHSMQQCEAHVTFACELAANQLLTAIQCLPITPIELTLGELILLKATEEFDLLALSVSSPDLNALNQTIQQRCQEQEAYAFNPYITLAAIQKSKADIIACKLREQLLPQYPSEHCQATGFALYTPAGVLQRVHDFQRVKVSE